MPPYDAAAMATPSLSQQGAAVPTPALGAKGGLGQVFSWMEGMKGAKGPGSAGKVGGRREEVTAGALLLSCAEGLL